jgi:hypothetical protein
MREFSKLANSQISGASTLETVQLLKNLHAEIGARRRGFLRGSARTYHTVTAIIRLFLLLPEAKRWDLTMLAYENLERHIEERDKKELDGEKLAAAMAAILSGQPEKSGGRPIVQGEHTQGKFHLNRPADKGKPKPEVRSHGQDIFPEV